MAKSINGNGPPTSKTRAQIGDFYIDQESQTIYKCTAVASGEVLDYGFIDIHQGHDNEYEWRPIGEELDDFLAIRDGKYLFYNCSSLTAIPKINTSSFTTTYGMFSGCYNLTEIPEMDTSNVTNMEGMFSDCRELTTIPKMNTSRVTNMGGIFKNCKKLITIPEMDTSNVTRMGSMFYTCTNITDIPKMNTSRVTTMNAMFNNCSSITIIPELDVSNVTDVNAMFYNCKMLKDLTIYNVRKALTIGSGTTYGHLLTVDSLIHTIKELCTVTTQQTLTMGSANLEKIADLYCKVIDDTTEKIEMELCESTDEGAITLSDYALMKNWLIQ